MNWQCQQSYIHSQGMRQKGCHPTNWSGWENPKAIQGLCGHLQWQGVGKVPTEETLGPQNWTEARSTCNANQQNDQTFDNRTTRTTDVHWWTPGKRNNQKVKDPLCGVLLLHQKEEWKTKAHTRLPTNQWMDNQKLIPLTTHSTTNQQNRRCRTNHSSQYPLGV